MLQLTNSLAIMGAFYLHDAPTVISFIPVNIVIPISHSHPAHCTVLTMNTGVLLQFSSSSKYSLLRKETG